MLFDETFGVVSKVGCNGGVSAGLLPKVPFLTEFAYAAATSIMFHLGCAEPASVKPSYLAFFLKITGTR